MNVHKRCEKNVANNCGINTRDMAQILQELGISGDKLRRPKKVWWSCIQFCCGVLISVLIIENVNETWRQTVALFKPERFYCLLVIILLICMLFFSQASFSETIAGCRSAEQGDRGVLPGIAGVWLFDSMLFEKQRPELKWMTSIWFAHLLSKYFAT